MIPGEVPITCTHCGHTGSLPEERYAAAHGKLIKCKRCQKQFVLAKMPALVLERVEPVAPVAVQHVATPPAPRLYPCDTCHGLFGVNHVYSVDGGYTCHRCYNEPPQAPQPAPVQQPQQPFIIQNIINNQVNVPTRTAIKRWEPGTAALLSFLFPGLGQMYKGQTLNGIVWMIGTLAGYLMFIVPGLILHLCCIIGAASGDPYR